MYELVGPPIPFWGAAYPERLTGGTVFLPGRLVDADTVEVGRTIARGEYEPGVRLTLEDVSPGRTVLVGDAETDPMPGTIESAAIVGSTVTFEATPADKTSVRELGSTRPGSAGRVSRVGPASLEHRALGRDSSGRRDGRRAHTTDADLPRGDDALRRGRRPRERAARRGHRARAAEARVFVFSGRLVVVPGAKGGEVVFTGTDADKTTVDELALGPEHALVTRALCSAKLPRDDQLTSPAPELAVTIGPVGRASLRRRRASTSRRLHSRSGRRSQPWTSRRRSGDRGSSSPTIG